MRAAVETYSRLGGSAEHGVAVRQILQLATELLASEKYEAVRVRSIVHAAS